MLPQTKMTLWVDLMLWRKQFFAVSGFLFYCIIISLWCSLNHMSICVLYLGRAEAL